MNITDLAASDVGRKYASWVSGENLKFTGSWNESPTNGPCLTLSSGGPRRR